MVAFVETLEHPEDANSAVKLLAPGVTVFYQQLVLPYLQTVARLLTDDDPGVRWAAAIHLRDLLARVPSAFTSELYSIAKLIATQLRVESVTACRLVLLQCRRRIARIASKFLIHVTM